MDVFEGRVKLIAFYQQSDAPRVAVEFGDKGEILHREINGVAARPRRPPALTTNRPRRGQQTATPKEGLLHRTPNQ